MAAKDGLVLASGQIRLRGEVQYGDEIALYDEEDHGYVGVGGFIEDDVWLDRLVRDVSTPPNSADIRWRIVSKYQYSARVALEKYLAELGKTMQFVTNGYNPAAFPRLHRLVLKDRDEHRSNLSATRKNEGSRILYGAVVQLQHVMSGKFLTAIQEIAQYDKKALKVELGEGGEGAWFEVSPGYNMIAEGSRVRQSDIICLSSVKFENQRINNFGVDWSALPYKRDLGPYVVTSDEIHLSSSGAFARLRLIHVARPAVDYRNPAEVVCGGMVVTLLHKDTMSYLSHDNVTPLFRMVGRGKATATPSSNTFWRIECATVERSGEPLEWARKFYRVQAVSCAQRLYLCGSTEGLYLSERYGSTDSLWYLDPFSKENEVDGVCVNNLINLRSYHGLFLAELGEVPAGTTEKASKFRVASVSEYRERDALMVSMVDVATVKSLMTVRRSMAIMKQFAARMEEIPMEGTEAFVREESMAAVRRLCRGSTKLVFALGRLITACTDDDGDNAHNPLLREGLPVRRMQKLLRNQNLVDNAMRCILSPFKRGYDPQDSAELKSAENADLVMIVRLFYRLLRHYCNGYLCNAMDLSRYLTDIQSQSGGSLSAAEAITMMFKDNRRLLIERVGSETVRTYVELILGSPRPRPDYIHFIDALLAANGKSLPRNQNLATSYVLEQGTAEEPFEHADICTKAELQEWEGAKCFWLPPSARTAARRTVLCVRRSDEDKWIPLNQWYANEDMILAKDPLQTTPEEALLHYHESIIVLLSNMCLGRNINAFRAVIHRSDLCIRYRDLLKIVFDPYIPSRIRLAYARMLHCLYLDRDPLEPVDPIQYVQVSRNAAPKAGSAGALGEKKSQFSNAKFKDYAPTEGFTDLKVLLAEYLEGVPFVDASQVAVNRLTKELLGIVHHMMLHGLYASEHPLQVSDDTKRLVPAILAITYPSTDKPEGERRHTARSEPNHVVFSLKLKCCQTLSAVLDMRASIRVNMLFQAFDGQQLSERATPRDRGHVPKNAVYPANEMETITAKARGSTQQLEELAKAMFDVPMVHESLGANSKSDEFSQVMLSLTRYESPQLQKIAYELLFRNAQQRAELARRALQVTPLVSAEMVGVHARISSLSSDVNALIKFLSVSDGDGGEDPFAKCAGFITELTGILKTGQTDAGHLKLTKCQDVMRHCGVHKPIFALLQQPLELEPGTRRAKDPRLRDLFSRALEFLIHFVKGNSENQVIVGEHAAILSENMSVEGLNVADTIVATIDNPAVSECVPQEVHEKFIRLIVECGRQARWIRYFGHLVVAQGKAVKRQQDAVMRLLLEYSDILDLEGSGVCGHDLPAVRGGASVQPRSSPRGQDAEEQTRAGPTSQGGGSAAGAAHSEPDGPPTMPRVPLSETTESRDADRPPAVEPTHEPAGSRPEAMIQPLPNIAAERAASPLPGPSDDPAARYVVREGDAAADGNGGEKESAVPRDLGDAVAGEAPGHREGGGSPVGVDESGVAGSNALGSGPQPSVIDPPPSNDAGAVAIRKGQKASRRELLSAKEYTVPMGSILAYHRECIDVLARCAFDNPSNEVKVRALLDLDMIVTTLIEGLAPDPDDGVSAEDSRYLRGVYLRLLTASYIAPRSFHALAKGNRLELVLEMVCQDLQEFVAYVGEGGAGTDSNRMFVEYVFDSVIPFVGEFYTHIYDDDDGTEGALRAERIARALADLASIDPAIGNAVMINSRQFDVAEEVRDIVGGQLGSGLVTPGMSRGTGGAPPKLTHRMSMADLAAQDPDHSFRAEWIETVTNMAGVVGIVDLKRTMGVGLRKLAAMFARKEYFEARANIIDFVSTHHRISGQELVSTIIRTVRCSMYFDGVGEDGSDAGWGRFVNNESIVLKDQALREDQIHVARVGGASGACELLAHNDRSVSRAALRLLLNMLQSGNRTVQDIMSAYLCGSSETRFFTGCAEMAKRAVGQARRELNQLKETEKHRWHATIVMGDDGKEAEGSAPSKEETKIMRRRGLLYAKRASSMAAELVGNSAGRHDNINNMRELMKVFDLMCRGRHRANQNIMRTQPRIISEVDVMAMIVDFAMIYQNLLPAALDLDDRKPFYNMVVVFSTLTTFIQGPNMDNIHNLLSTHLFEVINRTLNTVAESHESSETEEEILVIYQMTHSILRLLNEMLDGRDRRTGAKMLEALQWDSMAIIRDRILARIPSVAGDSAKRARGAGGRGSGGRDKLTEDALLGDIFAAGPYTFKGVLLECAVQMAFLSKKMGHYELLLSLSFPPPGAGTGDNAGAGQGPQQCSEGTCSLREQVGGRCLDHGLMCGGLDGVYRDNAALVEIIREDAAGTENVEELYFSLQSVRHLVDVQPTIKTKMAESVRRNYDHNPVVRIASFSHELTSLQYDLHHQHKLRASRLLAPLPHFYNNIRSAPGIIAVVLNVMYAFFSEDLQVRVLDLLDGEDDEFPGAKSYTVLPAMLILGVAHLLLSIVMLVSFIVAQGKPRVFYRMLKAGSFDEHVDPLTVRSQEGGWRQSYLTPHLIPAEKRRLKMWLLFLPFSRETWQNPTAWYLEPVFIFLYPVMSLLGLVISPLFYVYHALDIFRDPTIQSVLESVANNFQKLWKTGLLALFLIYVFAILCYTSFGTTSEAEFICENMFQCMVMMVYFVGTGSPVFEGFFPPKNFFTNNGLTADDDALDDQHDNRVSDAYDNAYDPHLEVWRILFSSFFGVVFILVLSAIISGLIIDSFGELRDNAAEVEEALESRCYICNYSRFRHDEQGAGYDHHVKAEHNYFQFLFLNAYIERKGHHNLYHTMSGQEMYVMDLMLKGSNAYYPINRSFKLQQHVDKEATDGTALVQRQKAMVAEMEATLERYRVALEEVRASVPGQ